MNQWTPSLFYPHNPGCCSRDRGFLGGRGYLSQGYPPSPVKICVVQILSSLPDRGSVLVSVSSCSWSFTPAISLIITSREFNEQFASLFLPDIDSSHHFPDKLIFHIPAFLQVSLLFTSVHARLIFFIYLFFCLFHLFRNGSCPFRDLLSLTICSQTFQLAACLPTLRQNPMQSHSKAQGKEKDKFHK